MDSLALWILIELCLGYTLSKELLQTNIVFRHGDRAPIAIYPNDKNNATQWPGGLGMLTQIGKEQQTRLGAFIRDRYKTFIGDKFDSREIYVRSSDVDRTLVSVYSNLAGLYALNGSDTWEGSLIPWQPVPVHSVPAGQDQLLRMAKPCAKLDALLNDTVNVGMNQLKANYSTMVKLLSKLTGYDEEDIDLGHIEDILFCENAHNMTWPAWAKWSNMTCAEGSTIPCFNRTVYDILTDARLFEYIERDKAKSMHKFFGGPLVMDILDNFYKIITDEQNTPQMYIYSAHDTTIAALLSALGAFNNQTPEYTGTVFIELYKTDTAGEHLVEVYYKNVTDNSTVWPLQPQDCASPCSLEAFAKAFQSFKIADWDTECYNVKGLNKEEVVTISICLAVVICLGLATIICYARRRRTSHRYTRVSA